MNSDLPTPKPPHSPDNIVMIELKQATLKTRISQPSGGVRPVDEHYWEFQFNVANLYNSITVPTGIWTVTCDPNIGYDESYAAAQDYMRVFADGFSRATYAISPTP